MTLTHLKVPLCFLLLLPLASVAQYRPYYLTEIFFNRQAGADIEALGKSSAFLDGDINAVHYNPAALSGMRGIQASFTSAKPLYGYKSATLNSFACGSQISNKINLGMSYSSFNPNQKFIFRPEQEDELLINTLRLSGSYDILKNLSIGTNINYLDVYPGFYAESKAFYGDIGLLKKIKIKTKRGSQSANLSSYVKNFTNREAKGSYDSLEFSNELPVIWTSGITYFYASGTQTGSGLTPFRLFATVEFQNLLNSIYNTQIATGLQTALYDILILRVGYYTTYLYDYGQPVNKDKLEELTYGIGIQIPIDKVTNQPLSITADYTDLPQSSYRIGSTEDHFKSLSLKARYTLGVFKN
jgi:hypothetical protein